MDNFDQQILIGSLLGDASIEKRGNSYRFTEEHSIKQRDYLTWKRKQLSKVLYFQPDEIHKGRYRIRSHANSFLSKFHRSWYCNGKKILGYDVFNIDNVGLAIWYGDDGGISYGSHPVFNLATATFTLQENIMLQEILLKSFDLKTSLLRDGKYFRLRFSQESVTKFLNLIYPILNQFISLRHKLAWLTKEGAVKIKTANQVTAKWKENNRDRMRKYWRDYYYRNKSRINRERYKRMKKKTNILKKIDTLEEITV